MPLSTRPRTGLLLGGMQGRDKAELYRQIAEGAKDILISTQVSL
jgi:hypothetical protein